MDEEILHQKTPRPAGHRTGAWILAILSILILLLALRQRRGGSDSLRETVATTSSPVSAASVPLARPFVRGGQSIRSAADDLPAEQVVSNKVAQFARSRREIADALAKQAHVEVPAQVKAFFDALEAGNWEAADALFKSLKQSRENAESPPVVPQEVWTAVREAYGVAEVAHDWPAQKLLDYGEAVLGSLRPGMVYVGGTDAGRFIPTLLNETSGGEQHVVLTQNAFADGSYLKYVEFLYGDRLTALNEEDSQRSFQTYLTDAQKRFAHDKDFPDEPKQLRPGEDIRMVDNHIQVSGQVAVMSINELLLQKLMEKNPDASFALEESFSLKSTYQGAAPLGPILELRTTTDQSPLTQERVADSLNYWRNTAQTLAAEPSTPDVQKTYAHMAMAQGNFFAEQKFSAEAEQAYRLASQMSPAYLDPVGGLCRLLVNAGRANEADTVLNNFARANPDQQEAVAKLRGSSLPARR